MKNNIGSINEDNCCGCGLCKYECPTSAISMQINENGYVIPKVEDEKCISCGKCLNKCIFINPIESKFPSKTFAAVRKDKERLQLSSSGGVFSSVADSLVKLKNWNISGAVLSNELKVEHIISKSPEKIIRMQGSKYVQSDLEKVYTSVKEKLKGGEKVLFSGTPCQVAAMQQFSGNHKNLYTIEVICHGVPNIEMFKSYISSINPNISAYYFRDKSQGWSFNGKAITRDGKQIKLNHRLSSFMTYYLKGEIYRECCYKCPFARAERCADLTIGDFWGVLKKHSEFEEKIDIDAGVSCLLVNSEKGNEVILNTDLELFEIPYQDIKDGNEPLNHPSTHTEKREKLLSLWRQEYDWKKINDYWKKNDYRFVYRLWNVLTPNVRHRIRALIGKR